MHLFSVARFVLLSSAASTVFGSSTIGDGLVKEQGKQQSRRNLDLQNGEVIEPNASDELMDNEISDLFEEVDDEVYNLLADSYNKLSDEINSALLEIDPEIDEEDLAYAREAFVDFLAEDSDVPDTTFDVGLPIEDPEEDEDADTRVGHDLLEGVVDESDGDGGMQRTRGYGRTSYRKYGNKGCRNYHGDKGSSHNDYDLYNYVSKSYCKSKCNSLGQHCYGYEYYSSDKKCEIWRVPIYHVEYVYGLDCYIK